MISILFLCTGNSCRSQMAEAWAKHLLGTKFRFYSAGIKKHGMNPYAIKVMAEEHIDMSSHFSKTILELPRDTPIDFVFTVCNHAHESCPYFPQGKIIHVGFDDPPTLTLNMADEEDKLATYRRVRDEIKIFILNLESYLG